MHNRMPKGGVGRRVVGEAGELGKSIAQTKELNSSALKTEELRPISTVEEVKQMNGHTEGLSESEKFDVQEIESGRALDTGSRTHKRTRPMGVSVIAVLHMLVGIIGSFPLLAIALLEPEMWAGSVTVIVLGTQLAAALFAVGWGLWHLERWARSVALVLWSIGCVLSLVLLRRSPIEGSIMVAIAGTNVACLSPTTVKEAFTRVRHNVIGVAG